MTRRRSALLGTAVVLVVSGVLAADRTPYRPERGVSRWVYDVDGVTGALEVVQWVGTRLAIVLVAVGLVIVGRYRAAGAAAGAGVVAWLATSGLKEWVERPRPDLATLGRAPRETPDNFAWPSSHSAIAFALATVLMLTVARGRIGRGVVAAAAVLTAVARVHLGAHWALDVIGGAALGALVGMVAVRVAEP